jgi:hypothetical protein
MSQKIIKRITTKSLIEMTNGENLYTLPLILQWQNCCHWNY